MNLVATLKTPSIALALRRVFARLIDIIVLGGLVNIVFLSLVFFVSTPLFFSINRILDVYVFVLSLSFCFGEVLLEPFFLYFFKGTPGKYILNLSVKTLAGARPGFIVLVKRSVLVWFYGLALGVPLVYFVTAWFCFKRLQKNKATVYDQKLGLQVLSGTVGVVRLGLLVLLVLIFLGINAASFYFASQHTESWRLYTAPNLEFSILFPVKPRVSVQEHSKEDLSLGVVTYRAYYSLYEGGLVSVRRYSKKLPKKNFGKLALILLSSMLEGRNSEVLASGLIKYNGLEAFEFKIREPQSGVISWGRFIFNNDNKVFLIMASYIKEDPKYQRMLDSFVVIK